MKLFRLLVIKGVKRVALLAIKDVLPDEEVYFDYGFRDASLPWAKADAKDQPGPKVVRRIRRGCPVPGCSAHVLKLPQHIKGCHPDITGTYIYNQCMNSIV